MDQITDMLVEFSKKHDLWAITKQSGIKCIENWLLEDKPEDFVGLTSQNFIFEPKEQALIFQYFTERSFIVRTTYILYTDKNKNISVGLYALDVDASGESVDDWLI